VEAVGFILAIGWYITGVVGSHTFCSKGHKLTAGAYLGGAMLGPIQFLLANASSIVNVAEGQKTKKKKSKNKKSMESESDQPVPPIQSPEPPVSLGDFAEFTVVLC
jgi:hypothetical protein